MPRIEIVPENWENSQGAKDGDGTPTIDVCQGCSTVFTEGNLLADDLEQASADDGNLTAKYPEAEVGSTDVAHPPYTDDAYFCALCSEELTDADD